MEIFHMILKAENKNCLAEERVQDHAFQQNDCSPLLNHNEIFPLLHHTQIYQKQ